MASVRSRMVAAALALVALGCGGGGERGGDGGTEDAAPDVPAVVDTGAEDAGSGMACAIDPDCDDRIICTIDTCADGVCEHEPCLDCCPGELSCVVGVGCREQEACTTNADCVDEAPCTLDRCRDGMFCEHTPQNGLCDPGQLCFAELGCIDAPPAMCESDADCTGGLFCLGEWSCQPEFGCQFVAAPDCDDDDACTVDSCDATEGCVHAVLDADGDGAGAADCGGDDCDDSDPAIAPGADEACGDEVDGDCDGAVDEGCCVAGEACTSECGTAGATTCDPAGCAPPVETCNGSDDDCDDSIDEDFECVLGTTSDCVTGCGSTGSRACGAGCNLGICNPPVETCNGSDDDCDASIDEGCCTPGGACTTDCGTSGTVSCAGGMSSCEPPAETCNGIDDDCDDSIDEIFVCAPGQARDCDPGCGSTGRQTCNNSCLWNDCVPPAEVCNGADDDCDSSSDETFECVADATTPCTTTCDSIGTQACTSGCTLEDCVPPVEVCNGRDDDCDGTCDDGFTCCRGQTVDCSSLGGEPARGTATCRSNCQGWDTSGCVRCVDETCNGEDDDCDGRTDEEVTRACSMSGCDGTETCVEGGSGTFGACALSVSLDDGVGCTEDSCDNGGSVVHTPNDDRCEPTEYCDASLDCQPTATAVEITTSIDTDSGRIDGVLSPSWVGGGRFEFAEPVSIASGRTVTVSGSAPLQLSSTGAISILGTLRLRGGTGTSTDCVSPSSGMAGARGGGGGGIGGAGGVCQVGTSSQPKAGDGGGTSPGIGGDAGGYVNAGGGGGAGHASAGADGLPVANGGAGGAMWGSDTTLDPGGGGGGGVCGYYTDGFISTVYTPGAAGGGGGGAVLLESTGGNVTVSGTIDVRGGDGGSAPTCIGLFGGSSSGGGGGGGAGGTIILRASGSLALSGSTLDASGGAGNGLAATSGGDGSAGRVRLEDGDGSVSTSGAAIIPPPTIGTY